jgi:hypothetical protein
MPPTEGHHITSSSLPAAGWILIDRCGKHFGTILNYLRDGAVPLPESRREIEELLAEAKYYLVQGLLEECQAALQVGTQHTYRPPFPSLQSGGNPYLTDVGRHFAESTLEPLSSGRSDPEAGVP